MQVVSPQCSYFSVRSLLLVRSLSVIISAITDTLNCLYINYLSRFVRNVLSLFQFIPEKKQ